MYLGFGGYKDDIVDDIVSTEMALIGLMLFKINLFIGALNVLMEATPTERAVLCQKLRIRVLRRTVVS